MAAKAYPGCVRERLSATGTGTGTITAPRASPTLTPVMHMSRLVVATVLLASVAGCSQQRDEPAAPTSPASADADEQSALRAAAIALVETRSAALRSGDRDGFLATVDQRETKFLETQTRWFDNLAALPLATIGLRLGDEDDMTGITADGDYQLPVELTLQLEGFDKHPVMQPMVYRFSADGEDVLLTADRNVQSDADSGWRPAPWDVTAIEVRTTESVLGVFDATTAESADEIMADVSDSVADLEGVVPPWSNRVVAYVTENVDALDKMSLMTVNRTGGVAFALPTKPGSERIAAHRLALNPAALGDDTSRGVLIRHEVGHVALGGLDDSSPTWLVEGSAEHLGLRSLPTDRVRGYFRALAVAYPTLPLATGRKFYEVRSSRNYNSAALVCSFLAETEGPETLWSLMRTFERRGYVSQADIDGIVRRELGRTTAQLGEDARAWALAG